MIDIRLGNRHNNDVKASEELIDAIKKYPGSCDTVWFATEYGYPELEVHRKSAQNIEKIANLYRDAGIKVSLQISNTIGHGEYMKNKDNSAVDTYNFEKMVGPDGTVCNYSYCWRGKNFTDYICKSIEAYMDINPETVWVDDDLRVVNHAPVDFGCFCDTCIGEFNNTYKTDYTRDKLVYEINYGDVSVREKYIEFLRKGLYDFTLKITHTVAKASPDTFMALQYARYHYYAGMDCNYLFSAMHDGSGKPVKARPGGGAYHDKVPFAIVNKMMDVGYANSAVPPYVTDNYPEIENTPDVSYGKSIYGTIKESTLDLAYGCTGLTFAVLMTPFEKMSFHEKMLKGFGEYRKYWDKLGEVSRFTKNGGAQIYEPPKAYLAKQDSDAEPFAWRAEYDVGSYHTKPHSLLKIGIPITHDSGAESVYVLSEGTIDAMMDEDITRLLSKPVVIDGPGFKKLTERGFGEAFDAKAEVAVSNGGFTEIFTDHPVNKGNEGMVWAESFFTGAPMTPHIITGDNIESLGTLTVGKTGETLGTSCAIVNVYDNEKNIIGKWAVFGYCIWKDIISSAKRQQIANAIDSICNNTFPALLESAEQVIVLPRVTEDGKTASVTLCNASIGKTDTLSLKIRNPLGKSFRLMNALTDTNANVTKDGNDYIINIPEMESWEILTVFCDR